MNDMPRLSPLPPEMPLPRARAPTGRSLGPCPLCGREMIAGPSVEEHHLVPRSEGGKATTAMHRVCHRKIHAEIGERELAQRYNTPEALLEHPEIASFVRWVARKPPEFSSATFKRKR